MQTISEMQATIKEMATQLNTLSMSLSDLNQKNADTQAFDFKKIYELGKRSVIQGHTLANAEKYIKKYYITLLACLPIVARTNPENAWLYLQRIVLGINCGDTIQELLADSNTITEDQIYEFTTSIQKDNLSQVFALDAMLIYLSCEERNTEMMELMSNFFQLLNCKKQEIVELAELAKIIVEKNKEKYYTFCCKNLNIDLKNVLFYIKPFHQGVMIFNKNDCLISFDTLTYLTNKDYETLFYEYECEGTNWRNEKIMETKIAAVGSKNVLLENVGFSKMPGERKNFYFCFANEMTLKNCTFSDTEGHLSISNSQKVDIQNCKFACMRTDRGYSDGGALAIYSIEKIHIAHTIFDSCYAGKGEYDTYAGAIYASGVKKLHITDCAFEGCRIYSEKYNSAYGGAIYLSSNTHTQLENCTFNDCIGRYRSGSSWYNSRNTIDWSGKDSTFEAKNCTNKAGSMPYDLEKWFTKTY